jgi:hypothetical protein
MILMWGSTRAVLPFGPWVFKFSRSEYGARCNRHEAELYARNRNKPHRQLMLCPVLWCSSSGKLQIARRAATPITQAQLDGLKRDQRAWNEWDYLGPEDDECPFEWKPTDWGVLDGRLVAVDYAATCHPLSDHAAG